MARLVAALGFPLGGEGLSGGKPWIVNLVPAPGSTNVKLLRPVRLTMRDAETFVDPGQVIIVAGYAKVHSDATAVFDVLPRTGRFSLFDVAPQTDPSISVSPSGVVITKTANSAQRSVYTTSIDAGSGCPSAIVTAVIQPTTITPGVNGGTGPLSLALLGIPLMPLPYNPVQPPIASAGAVLGMENGPRNQSVYLWFQIAGGVPYVRFTSFLPQDGSAPAINFTQNYDWTVKQRYTIVYNEAQGYVDVYSDVSGATSRLFRVPIASVPTKPNPYFFTVAGPTDIVALYGQEGNVGDSSTWSNIAVTTDVGYPLLGSIRPGDFKTALLGGQLVTTTGDKDPRDADIAPWFDSDSAHIANTDPSGTVLAGKGLLKLTKSTLGKTLALYRDEPGFFKTSSDGLLVQFSAVVLSGVPDGVATGTGVTIYDGLTVFQLMLFDDGLTKTVGLKKRFGTDADIATYFVPSTPLDWSANAIRFTVDKRSGRIRLYALSDVETPLLDIPLDRSTLPSSADYGWTNLTPFIAMGHTTPTQTKGTFALSFIDICHYLQEWEANNGLPTATNPAFTASNPGTMSLVSGELVLACPAGQYSKNTLQVSFGPNRGAAVEGRVAVTSWRALSRTGVYLFLDDGLKAFGLSFVEASTGKYACIAVSDGLGSFKEVVGKDGLGVKYSFPIDWTKAHTYRVERRPFDGLYVFVDNSRTPALFIKETDLSTLPSSQFSSTPTVGFGQFTTDGATATWSFVRALLSSGNEVSFKKNNPDTVLREELFATQAIVVADAVDEDV